MEPIRYAPTLGSAETSRTMSQAIWKDCPWTDIESGVVPGMKFFDDFLVAGNANMTSAYANSLGGWSSYGSAGATINDHAIEGGAIRMASDGDNEGLAMLGSAGGFQFMEANSTTAPVYHKRMWFEARVAKSTITTAKIEAFVGLMDPTLASGLPAVAQPITTTDDTLMTAGSFFGFHLKGTTGTASATVSAGPTEVSVAFVKASDTVNYPSGSGATSTLINLMASTGNTVLAAGTFVKLGWVFDAYTPYSSAVSSPTARQTSGNVRRKMIRFFVNGLECATFLGSDDLANATTGQLFPIVPMAPVLAVSNQAGSSPGYLACDWIRICQASYT